MPNDRQRIDKWLWHARMVRSRSDAAALTEGGHVRLNGRRMTTPGHLLRVGDVVTLALDRSVRVMQVEAFSERRGTAPRLVRFTAIWQRVPALRPAPARPVRLWFRPRAGSGVRRKAAVAPARLAAYLPLR